MKQLHSSLIVFALVLIGGSLFYLQQTKINAARSNYDMAVGYIQMLEGISGIAGYQQIHIHADVRMHIDNKQELLYTSENFGLHPFTHFHEGENQDHVIHVHAKGITLTDFLRTLHIAVTPGCINIRNINYCNSDEYTWNYLVNNQTIASLDYEIKDLDRILLSYGSPTENQIAAQWESVGSFSCIHSNNC